MDVYSDLEEYNLIDQSDDFENYTYNENQRDNDQANNLPTINDNEVHEPHRESQVNENLPTSNCQNYLLSEISQYELNLWLFNHRNHPYMNTLIKKKYAKRLNVSVEMIAAYLCEQRRIDRIKDQNQ